MKKIISIIITISMLLASVPAFAISGTGTESNPYLISSASDIAKIHNDLGGYYKLTNNIDMSGVAFEPIGNEIEGAFTGTIDGAGYTISSLNINLPDSKFVGFIGCLEGTVKNLNLINVEASGYRYVGGLVGYSEENSEISNCSVNGNVIGKYQIIDVYTGGIAGYNDHGTITDCKNSGKVTGGNYVGGIAGKNDYGTITNCENNGSISSSSSYVGGIAGKNDYGTITNCVNDGEVAGNYDVGGIAGKNDYGTITNCENSGEVTGSYRCAGGIAGKNDYGTITDCENNGSITGSDYVGGIAGDNYNGTITDCENSGEVAGNHYVGGIAGENSETITNCVNDGIISSSNGYVGGIAGRNDSGTITDCVNNGSISSSNRYVGGIAGRNYYGTITNCVNNGSITGYYYVDGIAGENGGSIRNIACSASTVYFGEKIKLSVTLNGYEGVLTYTSHDEAIAYVDDNGYVTGKKVGKTYITVTTDIGVTSTAEITVVEAPKPSSHISLNKQVVSFYINSTYQLSATVQPVDTTDSVVWSSSNSNCVTVSENGLITGVAVGTSTITAKTSSGLTATCYVSVNSTPIVPTSVTLSDTYITLAPEDAKVLNATLLPSNATETKIVWTSSNDDVATVDKKGVITAISEGFATIKAKTTNGLSHECVVKVVSASGPSVIVDNVKSFPAGIAKTKVNIIRNPGISGYKLTINYDDALLTPVSVTANEEFGGTLTTNLDDANRTEFNIVWYSNGDTDIDINGELFTIDFKVADNAELGDYSDISIEYGAKDICNTAGENIALYTESAKVTVEEPLPGDIYEDGDVNVYDLTLLARYMIGLAEFTDRQMEAANVTDDDLVDIKDVVKLAQYVVGWTGVELMSLLSLSDDIPETPTVTVGTSSVNDANEADIPVYIKNNTGIAAYRFVLDYNADDIEIVSITPSDFINPENFGTNLGQENDEGLIVFCYQEGNIVTDGELFTIKVRYKNPTDTSVSPISIKSAENNFCNQAIENVAVNYETGYALGDDYIVVNKVVGDTNFSCELYFDEAYEERSAKAIIAFYDGDGRMVQLQPSDITVKPGKVNLSIDYDKKAYSTYKLMIWEGMNSLKPITDVK